MPALITPFTRSGELDLGAHRHNVADMWALGMRGVLVAGSTGEGPYLEVGEREALTRAAREAAPRAFVLCGVHAESVRQARAMAAEAAAGGADAALVATPTTLVRHRPDQIEEFFEELGLDLPVFLYSVPQVTGVELGEAAVGQLAHRDDVAGMKDSGGDPLRAGRIVESAPSDFALFTGSTAALTLAITAGAFGAITASANYAPRLVRSTVSAARRSARVAGPLQHRLTTMATAIERHGVAAVKYAARRTGLHAGHARLPLRPLAPNVQRAIRRALDALD